MDTRMKFFNGVVFLVALASLLLVGPVFAKSGGQSAVGNDKNRYIVILEDLPLAAYDGRIMHTPERVKDSTRMQAPPTASPVRVNWMSIHQIQKDTSGFWMKGLSRFVANQNSGWVDNSG